MSRRILRVGRNFALPADAVTQTFAILAKRGVGKTYTGSVHAEEMLKVGAHVVALDPTGAWWGLRSSADGKAPGFAVTILGGEHGDIPLEPTAGEVIANFVVDNRADVILDVSLFRKSEVNRFATDFLATLYRRNRDPMHLFLDEADSIAPQKPFHGEERMLGAVEDIVRRGRIKGIGVTLITQRSAVLNKNVLTQAEILVALRTIAPQDQEAIEAWVKVHGTPEKRDRMMESLASLPKGTAWYWAPAWPENTEGIFQKVEVRKRETFNSSATPKSGEPTRAPKARAEVDLSALQKQMAGTIEKAKQEDPKELRKRILQLEAELRKKVPPAAPVKPIRDDRAVASLRQQLDDTRTDLRTAINSLRVLKHARDVVRGQVERGMRQLELSIAELNVVYDETPARVQQPPSPTTQPPPRPQRVVVPAAPRPAPEQVGETTLTRAHYRILAAIAHLHGIGIGKPRKTQVALWAAYSPTSGGYYNYLGQLRSAGLIDYGGDTTMFLTDEGLATVESMPEQPEIPATVDALQEQVYRMVGGSRARILKVLVDAGGAAIPKPELAEKAEFSPTSGGYYNYLGTLRSMGLIDYTSEGVVATPVLFLQGWPT